MPLCTIVGAGPGIGTGVAQAFAGSGYDIVLVSRNPETTGPIAAAVRESGATAHQFMFDATSRADTAAGFARITEKAGTPDVVIYNPANMIMASFAEVGPDHMEQTWSIMLYAAMNVVAAALPAMEKRGSGVLLFTGGGFAIEPSIARAPHSIAKAALRNYAHGLHLELREKGIHAGTVTVHRPISRGQDMSSCAAAFVTMAKEPADAWTWEQHYGK